MEYIVHGYFAIFARNSQTMLQSKQISVKIIINLHNYHLPVSVKNL